MLLKKCVKNIFDLFQLLIKQYSLRKYFSAHFSGRRVAIVGGAPELLGSKKGECIDSHDVVVRINFNNPIGFESDYGFRTDYRFIGATMLERHASYLTEASVSSKIITATKNFNFLKRYGVDGFFYHSGMPKRSFYFVKRILGGGVELPKELTRPPKSGFVFVSMLLKFSAPKKVTLFGFSFSESSAWRVVDYRNANVSSYDRELFLTNHCDPKLEVNLINALERAGVVSNGCGRVSDAENVVGCDG
jgi:hypothetical protein